MPSRAPRPAADRVCKAGEERRVLWLVLLAALLLACGAQRSAAGPVRPALKGAIGTTGAITSGDVNEGGLSLGLAGLWALDDRPLPRFEAGLMLLADDMGSETGPLRDPNDGHDMGTTEILHRAVYAAAFRVDLEPAPVKGWAPLGSGTWGGYQIVDDVRGTISNIEYATGFSLAAGVRYGFRTSVALAGVVRYHRVFDERVGRYVSFGAELTWW